MAPRKSPASQDQAQAQTPSPKQRNSFKLVREGRTQSFKQEAKAELAAQKPRRYAQTVSVYNGLTWEKLRDEFLLKKWPEEDFSEEPDRIKDQWAFETPGEFTEVSK